MADKTEYLCPGCLFLGKTSKIIAGYIFNCKSCEEGLKLFVEPKQMLLFKTFAKHNKIGYCCLDCKRFIPHPLDNKLEVTCPYFDCCFVGKISSLKKKNHSILKSENEILSIKEECKTNSLLQNKIYLLKEVITVQSENLAYTSSELNFKHKIAVYQAINNLLDRYPEDMIAYLLDNSRTGGFQHKIFQEYTSLLENSLPIVYVKNKKISKIESLLDENLYLFDGISTFEAIVNKGEIKNNTSEFYIGGRKATYTKPYYIGKLLNVVNKTDNSSVLNNVTEYSFSKINLNILDGTPVIVTHLRIPPHYQMGGMVHVNRIRKKICDKARNII